jgi:hypothetical protein
MALEELIGNVAKIAGFVKVYLAVPVLNARQKAALAKNLAQLDRNLTALLAYVPEDEVTLAAQDRASFDAPPIDPAYFVSSEGGDDVYIAGLGGGLSGEGVDWTLNRAIAWFKYVWTNGVNYAKVAPGLLPGSHCLTPEGYEFAKEFMRRTDLPIEAPRDFNPLDLPVKA